MNLALSKKLLVAVVVLAAGGLMFGLAPSSTGQDAKKTDKTEKKAKGKLPAYYADIVTEEQRDKIYNIQMKHQDKIAEMQAAVAAATKVRDTEIEAVLTKEQKDKLKAAQEEGAAKKKKTAADKKAADEGKKAAPAAEAKTTPKAPEAKSTTKPKSP